MYKCESCNAVSEVEAKCPACNADMKKIEEAQETPVVAPVTPEEPKA